MPGSSLAVLTQPEHTKPGSSLAVAHPGHRDDTTGSGLPTPGHFWEACMFVTSVFETFWLSSVLQHQPLAYSSGEIGGTGLSCIA